MGMEMIKSIKRIFSTKKSKKRKLIEEYVMCKTDFCKKKLAIKLGKTDTYSFCDCKEK